MSSGPVPVWTLVVLGVAASSSHPGAPGPRHHDREFWRHIVSDNCRLPEGQAPASLIDELSDYLGSPDPELRDDFAYSIPVAWIYRDKLLSKAEVSVLLRRWMANLEVRVGESGTDSVLLRSFSALDLSVLAALDNEQPVFDDADFRSLLEAAIAYLGAEQDLRGYDREKGWMHATAHTADLLKFLGRSRRLAHADQGRILDALASKLGAQGHAFAFGENERMARAVLSLVRRPDFDRDAFAAWLAPWPKRAQRLFEQHPLDTAEFSAVQNAKDLMRSLLVDLSLLERPDPAAETARTRVLQCLKEMR